MQLCVIVILAGELLYRWQMGSQTMQVGSQTMQVGSQTMQAG